MKRILFQSIDSATLAFLRITVGILAFADLMGTFAYYHLYKGSYALDQFQFRYYGFEWVPSFPEPFMSLLFVFLLLVAIAFALGWHYRYTAPLLFLGFGYTFVLEKAHYLNHGYLFCWLLFAMCFLPAWREWSWDVWKRPAEHRQQIPRWTVILPCMLMGIAYFFGGVAKINPDWMRAMPLLLWMQAKSDIFLIGPILKQPATAWFMAYGGMFLDLLVVPMLLWKRTRFLALGLALFFHFSNLLIFNIGIFPFLSMILTSLYFPADWPRRLLKWISARWKWLATRLDRWQRRMETKGETKTIWQADMRRQNAIILGFAALLLIHTWLPLRHHFIGKDVAWDEFGHRYAWRMMLRTKSGRATFHVVDKTTKAAVTIRPRSELTEKQARKMPTHPDMIIQYAHHLRDRYQALGQEVSVYADVKIRLNDGPYSFYIDKDVDLAQEEWSFWRPATWILENPKSQAPNSK